MSNELALAFARRMRARRVAPEATWRCRQSGCLLLAAWSTPAGIVWYAPTARTSRTALSVPGARHIIQAETADTGGALVTAERAGILTDQPVPILCKHHTREAAGVGAAEIRAHVERGLAAGKTCGALVSHADA